MANQTNVSPEENLEEEAKTLGKKIVLLLKASNLPEDVQIAIINLLPEMSLEQIGELVNLLSQNVARQGQANEELKKKLAAIKEKYEGKRSELADSVMKDLDDLESKIE